MRSDPIRQPSARRRRPIRCFPTVRSPNRTTAKVVCGAADGVSTRCRRFQTDCHPLEEAEMRTPLDAGEVGRVYVAQERKPRSVRLHLKAVHRRDLRLLSVSVPLSANKQTSHGGGNIQGRVTDATCGGDQVEIEALTHIAQLYTQITLPSRPTAGSAMSTIASSRSPKSMWTPRSEIESAFLPRDVRISINTCPASTQERRRENPARTGLRPPAGRETCGSLAAAATQGYL